MARKPRNAAQAASKSMKDAPAAPINPDPSDDEMPEAPQSHEPTTPVDDEDNADPSFETENAEAAEENANDQKNPDPDTEPQPDAELVQDDEVAPSTPAQPSNSVSRGATPPRGGRVSAIPRKRRIGRPPKNPPPDWDSPDIDSPNHVGTPAKRRRGRPNASGGRWSRHRGPSHISQVPLDKDGNVLDVVDDEVVLPEDPEGETKIDKNGVLQGDREYRVRTFTILNRGDKLYMLSTEPARCIGFRDSYLFFQKHRQLFKIIIDDDAKRDLISRDLIPHSYKGRAIGVVTARSVFKEFGSKIVVGGRKIVDDYNVKEARERGDVEGEIAVPEDRLPGPGEEYNRNQFVAWHGASSVYHTLMPSVPIPIGGKVVDPKKRKVQVTGDNWMVEHAREASNFNSLISVTRRENLKGVYDIHTNTIQYPKIMQPSHARWERLPPPDPRTTTKLMKGMSTLRLTGEEKQDDGAEEPSSPSSIIINDTHNDTTTTNNNNDNENNDNITATDDITKPTTPTIFSTVPAAFSRRFAIHDTYFESPQYSNQGIPGPDGDVHDLGTNGLVSIANPAYPEFMGPDILAELPPECKDALVDSAVKEWEWKTKWHREGAHGSRTSPLKSYAWFP